MTLFFYIDGVSTSFEKKELEMCLSKYSKVVLITYDQTCLNLEAENLKVFALNFNSYKTIIYFFKALLFLPIIFKECISTRVYFLKPKCFKSIFSSFLRAIYITDELRWIYSNHGYVCNESIHYSFWFNSWATSLAILKKNKVINNFYARTHGTDLFEDRVPFTKKIPFRSFQLKYIDKVFSVSKTGTNYLTNKYPFFKSKIFTSYLGTQYHGTNIFNENEIFTIVSCAKIRNIKRIHLIAEMLLYIDFPIKWIHIGSENKGDPTLEKLHSIVSDLNVRKQNVEVLFKGDLTNEEVFNFYLSNSINVFISVSETEGLPVSMMEAISCAIPIISTDVGGCKEIVNDITGMLVPVSIEPKSLAGALNIFTKSIFNKNEQRVKIVNYWKENFNIERNFNDFISLVNEKS